MKFSSLKRAACVYISVVLQAIGYGSVWFAYRVLDDEMTHPQRVRVIRKSEIRRGVCNR